MKKNYQQALSISDNSYLTLKDSKEDPSVVLCFITSSMKFNIYKFTDEIESSGLVECLHADSETGLVVFLKLDTYIKQHLANRCIDFILSLNPLSSCDSLKFELGMSTHHTSLSNL